MPIPVALVLYVVLLALVSVNIVHVLDWPLWSALVPTAAAAGTATIGARAGANRPSVLLRSLLVLGIIGLIATAGALAMPAWQVIGSGASASEAGRLAPMFVAALALYGANLWLDAALSGAEREELERLARLFSGPRLFPSLVAALLLTAGFVLALEWCSESFANTHVVTHRFLERGIIPPITVLLFFWGLILLSGKRWNGWFLRRALRRWRSSTDAAAPAAAPSAAPAAAPSAAPAAAPSAAPAAAPSGAPSAPPSGAPSGAASGAPPVSAGGSVTGTIVAGLQALADDGGRLDESLRLLWRRYEESYLVPRYISWAVPILGFIGTVLGISLAADGIRRIISSEAGLAGLSSDLSGAIAPLGIAFDTTLIALSLSVLLTGFLALVQRGEERTLAALEWEVREANRAR